MSRQIVLGEHSSRLANGLGDGFRYLSLVKSLRTAFSNQAKRSCQSWIAKNLTGLGEA